MAKFNFIVFVLLSISFYTKGQHVLPYDKEKISKNPEVNFILTDKRGIESKSGIVYYVENDLETLTAYKNSKIKWKTKKISICDEHPLGGTKIRWIKLSGNKLYITFGKHSFAAVNIKDGKIICLGSN